MLLVFILGEGEPVLHVEPVQDGPQELVGVEPCGADLEQEEVGVDHGVGEVALDVCHGLTAYLEAVSHPHTLHYLVERNLKRIHLRIQQYCVYRYLLHH